MIEYLTEHPNNITGLADHLKITRKEAQNLFRVYASHVQDAVDRALDLTEEYVILSGTGRGVPPSFKLSEAIAVLERLRPETWAKSSPIKGGKKSKKTQPRLGGGPEWEQEAKQRFGRGNDGATVHNSVEVGKVQSTGNEKRARRSNSGAPTNGNGVRGKSDRDVRS